MASVGVGPSGSFEEFGDWRSQIDLIVEKFGAKSKTRLMQGIRQGGPVCLALTEKWIKTGLAVQEAHRKYPAAQSLSHLFFRNSMEETLDEAEGGAMPPKIRERQKEYETKFDADLESAQSKSTFPKDKEGQLRAVGQIMRNITSLDYEAVASGVIQQGTHGLTQFALNLATHLRTIGERNVSAFFHLKLRQGEGGKSHAVGFKRGKLKQPRHYSLFDANFYEITAIKESDLARFIEQYAFWSWVGDKSFLKFRAYQLFRVANFTLEQQKEAAAINSLEVGFLDLKSLGDEFPDDED
jgi:hypothetical protein